MILIERMCISPVIVSFSFNSTRQSTRVTKVSDLIHDLESQQTSDDNDPDDEEDQIVKYLQHSPASALLLNISDASFKFNGIRFRSVFDKKSEVIERVQGHYAAVGKHQIFKVSNFFYYVFPIIYSKFSGKKKKKKKKKKNK
jgi:hypothetical protein